MQNSPNTQMHTYLRWLRERGINVPFFQAAEPEVSAEEPVNDTAATDIKHEVIEPSVEILEPTSKDDLSEMKTLEDSAVTNNQEIKPEQTQDTINNADESGEIETDSAPKILPVNPQKQTHEFMTLKFYGSLSAKYLFVFDIESEAEFHPASSLVKKISAAMKLGETQLGVAVVRGHKRNKESLIDDRQFVVNELTRLNKAISAKNPDLKVVIMGAHMLSLFDPSIKFFEVNGSVQSYDYLNYLITWHPMDMIQQNLLKKDCWTALQNF